MRLLLFLFLISMLLGGCRKNESISPTSSFDLDKEYGAETKDAFRKSSIDPKSAPEKAEKPVAGPDG